MNPKISCCSFAATIFKKIINSFPIASIVFIGGDWHGIDFGGVHLCRSVQDAIVAVIQRRIE